MELAPFEILHTAVKISDVVTSCAKEVLHEKMRDEKEQKLSDTRGRSGEDILSVLRK